MRSKWRRGVFFLLLWGEPCLFKDFCSNNIISMLEKVCFSCTVIPGSVHVDPPEELPATAWQDSSVISHQRQRDISVNIQQAAYIYMPRCSSTYIFFHGFFLLPLEIARQRGTQQRTDSQCWVTINMLRAAVCFGQTSEKADLCSMDHSGLILNRAEHWQFSPACHQPLFGSCKGCGKCQSSLSDRIHLLVNGGGTTEVLKILEGSHKDRAWGPFCHQV